MNAPAPVSEEELHAFIDGELDDARAAEVAVILERDPLLAARVAAFKADQELLARTYAPLLGEAVPEAWQKLITQRDEPRERRSTAGAFRPLFGRRAPPVSRVLAAIAASIILIFGGWTFTRGMAERRAEALVAEALEAHAGTRAATTVTDADAALKSVLKLPLKAPDLTAMGYTLASVQVYEGESVKLDYRDGNNRLFTLYLKPSSGTPRFDMLRRGNSRVCIWQDDVLSTIMVGEMSAGEMLRLASMAYAGLS